MVKSNLVRCVHCLRDAEEITADHLFPRSWYPTTTPQNIEKWKFPACVSCNREYGKLEEQLRLLFAACVDPEADAAAGIWSRAFDSINPSKARNGLDAIKRKSARSRFLKRVKEADPSWVNSAIPEIHADRPKGNLALLVPVQDTHKFIEKLVRGTIYLTEQRYIESNQEITVSLLRPEDSQPIVSMLEQFGEFYERGPGIRIRKAVAHDAKTNALFVFDIWDQFRFHGSVMDRA
jgi:hypothetical protein